MKDLTCLCLRCRTLICATEACDICGESDVVSLADRAGRDEAEQKIWTSHETTQWRPSWLALVINSAFTVLCLWGFWWGLFEHYKHVIGIVSACALPICLLAYVAILGFVGPKKGRRRNPMGSRITPQAPKRDVVIGIVEGDDSLVAEAFELSLKGGGVMLRRAWSFGFDIVLEDDQKLHIPEGRLRIDAHPSSWRDIYLPDIWEKMRGVLSFKQFEKLFPYDKARAVSIRGGMEVQVNAELMYEDGQVSYREVGRRIKSIRGLPWVSVLES